MTQYPVKNFFKKDFKRLITGTHARKTRRLFMAKGFSPLIGLAVVVALAIAAVFGALSLSIMPTPL